MLRALSGTITTPGGGTLQSGIIRFTPVGTMTVDGGAALAPIALLFSVSSGAISSGSIEGGIEYLVDVYDGALERVYPQFRVTLADSDDPITWGTIYADANIGGPPSGTPLSSYILQILDAQKGAANGVAQLDSGGAIPIGILPESVRGAIKIMGEWNATTNSPELVTSEGTPGFAYQVSVAGSTVLDAVTSWSVGDLAVYDGTVWRKVGGTSGGGAVESVNGQTGAVVIGAASSGAAGLMSAADKSKLDGVAAGATVNATNAELRDRATHTGTQPIATIEDLQTELDAKATSAGLTAEQNARILADAALQAEIAALKVESIIDLEAMPAEYSGGASDAEKLQWAVDRLLLTNDGDAAERNIVVLVPEAGVDVTAAAWQEEGTLGTYGLGTVENPSYGTRYGACAQILIPATGDLYTHRCLTLTFRAKVPTALGYSVVNTNPANVLPTTCVIRSDATPPAGEGGNYAMIGCSRALDGYAGFYLTNVVVIFDDVTFRSTGNITPFDTSHAFSIRGGYLFDNGRTSDVQKDHDPRRNPDGTAYTGGAEIEFRKWSFGLKTPRIANGGMCHMTRIYGLGFRVGFDVNEHLHVDNAFINYCFEATRLRGMAHTAHIVHLLVQRCPKWIVAPPTGDHEGVATVAKVKIGLVSGETYHPGEFGNPPGDEWFNHITRIEDPSGLWIGEVTVREHEGEEPPTRQTIAEGHGANVIVRLLGVEEVVDNEVSFASPTNEIAIVGGAATVNVSDTTDEVDAYIRATEGFDLTWGTGLAAGVGGTVMILGELAALDTASVTVVPHASWPILWDTPTGAAPTIANLADDDVIAFEYRCITGPLGNFMRLRYVVHGNVEDSTNDPTPPGAPAITDTFTAEEGYNSLHGSAPDTTNAPGGNWIAKSGAWRRDGGTVLCEVTGGEVVIQGGSANRSGKVTFIAEPGLVVAAIANHNNQDLWNTIKRWEVQADVTGGTVKLFFYNASGGNVERDSAAYEFEIGTTYTIECVPSGDLIVGKVDGVSELGWTESDRPEKSNTYVGMRQSADDSAITQFDGI